MPLHFAINLVPHLNGNRYSSVDAELTNGALCGSKSKIKYFEISDFGIE
ncbi:hypothetical protein [Nostoc sp.]